MKKLCSKHGAYPYTEQRCPECFKQRDVGRNQDNSPYDYRWRKWRAELKKDFLYSFCWLTLLEDGKFNYDVAYHHIIPITTAPELQFEVYNVVPLTAAKHNTVESNPSQYDWKSIKKAVTEKLRQLGRN